MEKIVINNDTCLRCGACVGTAPNNFKFEEGNDDVVVNPDAPITDDTRFAADACPMRAISIVDDETVEETTEE